MAVTVATQQAHQEKHQGQHQHGDQSEGFVITDPVVQEFNSSAFRIDL